MATGNENMSDAFEILEEKQVSFTASATYDLAKSATWNVLLENISTGLTWRACGVELESSVAGTATLGFSLRLQPGRYRWLANLRSNVTGGMKKPKQQGTHSIHNEADGSVPAGWLGSFAVKGSKRPYFLFSGTAVSLASVKAYIACSIKSNNRVTALLTLEDLTVGSSITSPEIYTIVDPMVPIWTEMGFMSVKPGHLYKARVDTVTAGSDILSCSIGL